MTASQTWMITGAGSGLGRALTIAALDAGHRVVGAVRSTNTLPAHAHLRVVTLDVRDRRAVRDTVADAETETGGVDVLVNNAGYGLIGAVEEASEEDVRAILDTDLLGALWTSQAVAPFMRTRGRGRIVQISTVGAVGTMPLLGLYNAAKWGLEGFSEAMAAEVAPFGIRVTIVEPGALDTEWAGRSMRFSEPLAAYDPQREALFGTAEVPWPAAAEDAETGRNGMTPEAAAAAILAHVAEEGDERLRILVGEDAAAQVHQALQIRLEDYGRDARYPRG